MAVWVSCLSSFGPANLFEIQEDETRRPDKENMRSPISLSTGHGALSFAGFELALIKGIAEGKGTRDQIDTLRSQCVISCKAKRNLRPLLETPEKSGVEHDF